MSYSEYYDLFHKAQKTDCKYHAYLIDVKNSKTNLSGENEHEYTKFHKFVNYITNVLLKINEIKNEKIFLVDEQNKTFFGNGDVLNNNLLNPMILGDAACFFLKDKKITDEMFIEILCDAMKKFDINFSFHYMSGKYQTNDYAEGGDKLYKGYMLPLLEKLSKKDGLLIDKNYLENKENDKKTL